MDKKITFSSRLAVCNTDDTTVMVSSTTSVPRSLRGLDIFAIPCCKNRTKQRNIRTTSQPQAGNHQTYSDSEVAHKISS